MLTRFKIRRDFRVFARYLSDKPSDSDGKSSENTPKAQVGDKKAADASTEKIQELLKSMMRGPTISDSEYKEKFTVAKDRRQRKQVDEIEVKTEKIEESITKAAGEVAQAIGGNIKQTEAELLSKVLGKINQTSTSLSDLITGMKVDHSQQRDPMKMENRGQRVKRMVDKPYQSFEPRDTGSTRYTQRKGEGRGGEVQERQPYKKKFQPPTTVNIFSGQPLGIFKAQEPNYGTQLEVWESLKERELNLATTQPPANYFEKMALWTEQGKVWKFPIDNEQGMEEEQSIHFSEHIFLDAHLEGWCPKKGPIRHFMELVCVGLSKNAFYTAQEKKDHIMWYKEYFESKAGLLTEVGAWETNTKSEAST